MDCIFQSNTNFSLSFGLWVGENYQPKYRKTVEFGSLKFIMILTWFGLGLNLGLLHSTSELVENDQSLKEGGIDLLEAEA